LQSEARPDIAVVIPTRRREPRLAFALDALARQTLPQERFEAIVVRDSDAREPLAVAPEGLNARFLTQTRVTGPTAKRNRAWRSSKAPLIAFMDDDCRPAPDWLERVLEVAAGPELIVQGRTEPDPDELHLLFGLARSQTIRGPSDWYQCCNIAYPRELLERVGGFDEAFEFGGEDTDLGLRAIKAGARVAYADRAVVWHAVLARPFPVALAEAARWPSLPLVIARHPEQRRAIYMRHFWKRSHALLALAFAGAVLGRGRRTALALGAVPYLALNVRWRSQTPRGALRQAAHLPVRIAVDAMETAATVRAAAHHRVLVV